jgi:hypothetical protein
LDLACGWGGADYADIDLWCSSRQWRKAHLWR